MFEFKEMSVSDGETEGGRQTETEVELSKGEQQKKKKKELRMDALLIALNHSTPLCLRRCVDTTSANTQGRC